jgi:hypothetical protein
MGKFRENMALVDKLPGAKTSDLEPVAALLVRQSLKRNRERTGKSRWDASNTPRKILAPAHHCMEFENRPAAIRPVNLN